MTETPGINTTFDVRTDAHGGDPDRYSKTLRRYHRLLWGRPLPDGTAFELDAELHHESELGEFQFASDAITHTYSQWTRPPRLLTVLSEIPSADASAFYDLACTIGGYAVFPTGAVVNGRRHNSINQARGIHPRIRDRFDLTLECIRRHYVGKDSPLGRTLTLYAPFFNLFGSFQGYVDHFLLNDLVSIDYADINFLAAFDDFTTDPLPAGSVSEYRDYMARSMSFINARNARIAAQF